MPTAGETFANNYEIISEIRPDDGVTEAFHAKDKRTGNEVTLEILSASATSVAKARFGTRARRLLPINHSSLLKTLEVAATHCAFESPSGDPLSTHAGIAIARARQKLAWLSQIAGAIAALHKAGVVHGQIGLGQVILPADGAVKLSISLGADVTTSPVDDMRAFGAAACELVLGNDLTDDDEAAIAKQLVDAGLPLEPAQVIARVRAGAPMTSADAAEKLTPYAEFAGPSTEPLLPIAPRTSSH